MFQAKNLLFWSRDWLSANQGPVFISNNYRFYFSGEEGKEREPLSCEDLEFGTNITWPNHHLSKDDQLALLYKVVRTML